jgi:NAD(P)-dependent dehydrogenase (short-subunit alcohol dehydrogenase family)
VSDGRVVAVTGAARGIGLAIAREVAKRFGSVAMGDLRADDAQVAAHSIGANAVGYELDVTDPDSFERFLDRVEGHFGSLDVLVNNAGIMTVGALQQTKPAAASKIIDVNVKGVLYGMKLALPRLGRGGHVVNVVSSSAWIAPPYLATYSASKHAARALTDAVRDEARAAGINVTGVYPGFVQTDLAVGTKPARGQKMLQPSDVAVAVVDALEKPRSEVFVPRSLGATLRLWQALPPRARAAVGKALALDELYAGVDADSRRQYEDSLAG